MAEDEDQGGGGVNFNFIDTRAETLAAIATGIDADSLNDEGYAPLHLAKNEEVAQALVKAKADVHVRAYGEDVDLEDEGATPLHLARDAGVVRVLVEGDADTEAENGCDCTPLHRSRNAGVVDALINADANMEAEDIEGMTPLERAKNVEVARALLDGGAHIEHWRPEYGTSLVNRVGNEDIALLLVERGANVNISFELEDGRDDSAVWRHVMAENFSVIREMLRKNADVDSGDLLEATKKQSGEMIRLLIGKVGVSVTNKRGLTVLHGAKNHTKHLLDFGADVHARDNEGNTPLHTTLYGKVATLLI